MPLAMLDFSCRATVGVALLTDPTPSTDTTKTSQGLAIPDYGRQPTQPAGRFLPSASRKTEQLVGRRPRSVKPVAVTVTLCSIDVSWFRVGTPSGEAEVARCWSAGGQIESNTSSNV